MENNINENMIEQPVLDDILSKLPPVDVPKDLKFDSKAIMAAARRRKKQKTMRSIVSVAAAFAVLLGSVAVLDNMTAKSSADEATFYSMDESKEREVEMNMGAAYAMGLTPEESYFEEAMADLDFSASVESMDLGYGYRVLDYTLCEDNSCTFVVYFYEEDRAEPDDGLSQDELLKLQNVRSIRWIKND